MRRNAFSLIETLVVIAIIAIVAGILLPVLVKSKNSAHKTDDLSKLRQLGLAAAMYEDRYGEFPISSAQLVATGMVPKELTASVRDSSEIGIANEVARYSSRLFAGTTQPAKPAFKNSFIGLAEFGLGPTVFRDYVTTGPAAGWLIDVTESERTILPTPTQWKGTYRRLLTDGAVVTRQYKDYDCYNSGKVQPCRMSVLLFVDPSPYFAELQKSDDQQSSSSRG